MARPKQKVQLPSLETGPMPLHGIRDAARRQLIDLIDSRRGRKALLLDPTISGPLTLLDSGLSALLTEHGVARLLYLSRTPLDAPQYNTAEPKLTDLKSVIYVARATVENAQTIAAQIKASSHRQHAEVSVFWVPRRAVAVEKVFDEEGLAGAVAMGAFALDMVPVEDDVLSLELGAPFRECVLEGDSTSLFYAATALMRLQGIWGLFPRIQARTECPEAPSGSHQGVGKEEGKGPAAAAVKDMCLKMAREAPQPTAPPGPSRVGRVVLIDREVDLVTPWMTQITFEGLIDEICGIKNGAVLWAPRERGGGDAGTAGASSSGAGAGIARASSSAATGHAPSPANARVVETPRAGGAKAGAKPSAALLNSSDPFYREFRDLPYPITSQRLQQYAREARQEYGQLGSKDISQLKTFVKGLPALLALDRLSDIAAPVADAVRQQAFHSRLKVEQDLVDHYEVDEAITFIQELMWHQAPMAQVLRLLALLSATQGGVPRRSHDTLRHEFLSAYGHQHLATLNALETAGLLRGQGAGRSQFPAVRKALKLLVPEDEAAAQNPDDVAHIYKGYAPISVRLVEAALGPAGWGGAAEALSLLPGAQFDVVQAREPSGHVTDKPWRAPAGSAAAAAAASASPASAGGSAAAPSASAGGPPPPEEPEVVVVAFLGGATFSEVSALRWLAARPRARHRFLVLTSCLVNGSSLMDTFVDPYAAAYPSCAAAGAAAG